MKVKHNLWLLILVLTTIEQGIKIFINQKFLNSNITLLSSWIYFKPVFNRDYSWINSLFKLGVSKWFHIILVSLLLLIIVLFFNYLVFNKKVKPLVLIAFVFLISGSICSLIDKIFWNGSLDYIYVKGFFTFDLKDVYINIFTGLILYMILTNYYNINNINERKLIKDFMQFIRKHFDTNKTPPKR